MAQISIEITVFSSGSFSQVGLHFEIVLVDTKYQLIKGSGKNTEKTTNNGYQLVMQFKFESNEIPQTV